LDVRGVLGDGEGELIFEVENVDCGFERIDFDGSLMFHT